MKTIEQHWIIYRDACYGNTPIHHVQEKETKQAFFSGVLTALSTLSDIAETLPENEAVDYLAALTKEAVAFGAKLSGVKP